MIFACSLIELYQLGGWYLNANYGEIGYIYMTELQNSELRNLFDIIHVFKCTAYC